MTIDTDQSPMSIQTSIGGSKKPSVITATNRVIGGSKKPPVTVDTNRMTVGSNKPPVTMDTDHYSSSVMMPKWPCESLLKATMDNIATPPLHAVYEIA